MIPELRKRYGVPVGYSGHETGIPSSVAATALGACVVERHITLDRSMWGSDQAASLEPSGITRLARDIRLVEESMGDGVKRVEDREVAVMKKLRRVGLKA
jgi:N-acetylneuraminate synthase